MSSGHFIKKDVTVSWLTTVEVDDFAVRVVDVFVTCFVYSTTEICVLEIHEVLLVEKAGFVENVFWNEEARALYPIDFESI